MPSTHGKTVQISQKSKHAVDKLEMESSNYSFETGLFTPILNRKEWREPGRVVDC